MITRDIKLHIRYKFNNLENIVATINVDVYQLPYFGNKRMKKLVIILIILIPLTIKGGYIKPHIHILEIRRIEQSIEYFKHNPKIVRSLKAYKNRVINKKI